MPGLWSPCIGECGKTCLVREDDQVLLQQFIVHFGGIPLIGSRKTAPNQEALLRLLIWRTRKRWRLVGVGRGQGIKISSPKERGWCSCGNKRGDQVEQTGRVNLLAEENSS